ncbi:ExeM/NucH family extracellular endonuclease [Nocardioides bruguierae]|uniref:ExeM/NucH family extracellular endonuclease n=1 Tax=Nocardioides bruguierae TaxID=2945102 RepID=A0A9X2D593_9ACTN|nr:ExeM/NucH family extracellular endonuclease [Nocardioides bruguierae]MCM0619558.1 ExeM/NucH family extracellular endonuclease [Nocardioides bruguierae]
MPSARKRVAGLLSVSVMAAGLSPLVLTGVAQAATDGSGLVISEVYGGGGNSGATWTNDFIELYNPTDAAISVDGMSVQYRSSGGNSGGTTDLSGSVAPGATFLIQEAAGNGGTDALPTPDAEGTLGMSGSSGTVSLVDGTEVVDPRVDASAVVDLVGYGSASIVETAAAPGLSSTTSASRAAAGTDTDDNSADFTAGAPSPTNSAGETEAPAPDPVDPVDPDAVSIAEIQGTDAAASPLDGDTVTTEGVVTAVYETGGLNAFVIQTGGTGAGADATPGASDAVYVYGPDTFPAVGDSVAVTATVDEYNSLTELVDPSWEALETALDPVTPLETTWFETEEEREAHESELILPTGDFTVSNTYSTNGYGTIGLASGDTPLIQPTEVEDAQTGDVAGIEADNDARALVLDDGSSANYLGSAEDTPMAWLTTDNPIRVGAAATFESPVIVDYRYGAWTVQPTAQVTDDGSDVVSFENTRLDEAAPAEVGGALTLSSFNVLNYFTYTGEDNVADGGTCDFYVDREDNPIGAGYCDTADGGDGPRGAATDASLARQEVKIVKAINTLDADIVSLEEIENSVKFGFDRDAALSTLVDALNADAGETKWAFVPSPDAADLPDLADQDVIRTAFIYQPAAVETVGASSVLTGDAAFDNAREPLAQGFKLVGDDDANAFGVIVNHLKSKGSGTDDGTGQGNANPDRVAQATSLSTFADDFAADLGGSGAVFLTGDFNSYTMEDPMQVLYDDGYTDLAPEGEYSYSYSGLSGSLDHVLANEAGAAMVTGSDIWNINSGESVGFEYSRYNYNATLLYQENKFRASDHDPVVVGVSPDQEVVGDVDINLLNINDFHGRISEDTPAFATAIEQLREAEDNTLFLSAGDNIGASLFASSIQDDQPTIDVLNALGLDSSAVGNHEFDKGVDDLTGRVSDAAGWDYLAANVYDTDGDPILPEYDTFEVDGVTVGVIGVVTEETPSLVSPAGVADLTFGDPVEAVNRVAAELSDGDESNGEADVIVAEYHEGASAGTPDDATLEDEITAGGAFADIVENTAASVDVIFTGHTHKQYAWDGPIPGESGTRPVLQTGSYGENIGQVVLTVDPATGDVVSYTQQNVSTEGVEADTSYPRVAEVSDIVDAALAYADEIGQEPIGTITGDVTTAFTDGSYVDGEYTGGTRDDRSSESTLGDMVAEALLDGVSDLEDGADLGLTNPGGLRAELYYDGEEGSETNTDGVVTYAEANAVLPFGNTVTLVDLTGAQLLAVLEEQWQRNDEGEIPSRPYLQLGLSENVAVTADPTAPEGERITSVTIDGEPVDESATYTVSTLNFLAAGGDNFRTLAEGDAVDTGLLDVALFRDYLAAETRSPDFARQQVFSEDLPTELAAGEATSFTLGMGTSEAPVYPINDKSLDLRSQGSPLNTSASVGLYRDGALVRDLGDVTVTDGLATVDVTVPALAKVGDTLEVVADESGTTVSVPVTSAVTDVDSLLLLNINDFHGRISEDTPAFATTIEELRAEQGEDSTLFLSAGDNIGASLFASSIQDDQPTIDVLNALGLASSAVGNHEFDKGVDDLTGRVSDAAGWDYLAANVYDADGEPILPEYDTFEVDGVTVGVIGAVTEETPSLVSPAGVEGLTFGDPVEAVNRVAAELSDGDESNGEADVIVAEYHEGATDGTPDGASLEDEIAAGGAFADIVENTAASVDVIFTGHTHKQYAWEGPIPGEEGTRPILQTGSYGENIGAVTLQLDTETGDVIDFTQENVSTGDTEVDASYPRVAEVVSIVDAALAYADEVGSQPVGTITDDFTTAFKSGSIVDGEFSVPADDRTTLRDDRSRESTLGTLVADSLLDAVSGYFDGEGADFGVTNSGGLRAELYYDGEEGSETNTDGVVTYAEANQVLPFGNEVSIVALTGAQVKELLEQQWQPSGVSRPYLQLGLSENVSVTADPTAEAGSRITSVMIDGEPLDMGATYQVSTLNFLAAGGDNFTALAESDDVVNTGIQDAAAFRDYLSAETRSPDFARQQVFSDDLPTALPVGSTSSFTLGMGTTDEAPTASKTLDLTSLSSPVNTEVVATLGETELGTFTVTDGIADIDVDVPADAAVGDYVTFTAAPSGTTVTVPVGEATSVASTTTATVVNAKKALVNGNRKVLVKAKVRAEGTTPTGTVTLSVDGQVVDTAELNDNGGAYLQAGPFYTTGKQKLVVTYQGSDEVDASSATTSVFVKKAKAGLSTLKFPAKATRGTTHVSWIVTVRALGAGTVPDGRVVVRTGGERYVGRLTSGQALITTDPYRGLGVKKVVIRYTGSDAVHARKVVRQVRVTR